MLTVDSLPLTYLTFSQALAHCRASDAMWWRQIAECGFLCGWEVLLGAGGNGGESAGILEDAASAVRLERAAR